jgi:predicted ArsR family transcriptional regulator
MCQSLVDKVAQSEQLVSIVEMDLLVMFEDWLEELETEVLDVLKKNASLDEKAIAGKLGLSNRGAAFLMSKLKRQGRL